MKKRINSLLPQVVGACTLLTAATTGHTIAGMNSMSDLNSGGFYIVPSAGYHMTDILDHYDKINKVIKPIGAKIDFDDGGVFGIAFGFQTTAYTAIEFAYNYSKFDIKLEGKDTAGTKHEHGYGTSFHYLHVDALYYFSDIYENDFSFYIPVGLGYSKNDPKLNDETRAMHFKGIEDTNINFGVGAYYRFSDHFGVRGDIRGLYGISQSNFDAFAQVGITFRFGMPVPVEPAAGTITQSASLQFKLNSTDIVNANDPDIAIVADAVRNNPNAKIKILAYSDRSGNSEYNMKLSQRRAEKLKNILMDKFGVDESRIYTKAFGDEAGRSRDRRAVAIVEY